MARRSNVRSMTDEQEGSFSDRLSEQIEKIKEELLKAMKEHPDYDYWDAIYYLGQADYNITYWGGNEDGPLYFSRQTQEAFDREKRMYEKKVKD